MSANSNDNERKDRPDADADADAAPRFASTEARMRKRRAIGFAFLMVCWLATMTAVAALSVMLSAIIFKVSAGVISPEHAKQARASADSAIPDPSQGERVVAEGGAAGFLMDLVNKRNSSNPQKAGFKVGVRGSLWLLALTALLSIPIGIGAAVFLEEYRALPDWLRGVIQLNIANLAGVPSIVYGMLGLIAFHRAFGYSQFSLGPVLLAGALTLSLLVLPVIIIATQEALRAVPQSLRQAALGLGATPWQVVRDHVLPSSMPGILTGTILALSRAVGETAPLLMVGAAASILKPPSGPLDRYSALPVEIYNYAREPAEAFKVVAAGGILLLLVLLLSMNAIAITLRNRYGRVAHR